MNLLSKYLSEEEPTGGSVDTNDMLADYMSARGEGDSLYEIKQKQRQVATRMGNIQAQSPALDWEQEKLTDPRIANTVEQVPLVGGLLRPVVKMAADMGGQMLEGGRSLVSSVGVELPHRLGITTEETYNAQMAKYGPESPYAKAIPDPRRQLWNDKYGTEEENSAHVAAGFIESIPSELARLVPAIGASALTGGVLGATKAGAAISAGVLDIASSAQESEPIFKQSVDYNIAQGMDPKQAYDTAFGDYWKTFALSMALNAPGAGLIFKALPDTVKSTLTRRLVTAGVEGVTEAVEEGMQQGVITKDMSEAIKTTLGSGEAFVIGALGGAVFSGNGRYETTPEMHRKAFVKSLTKGVEVGGTREYFENGNQYRATKQGKKDWKVDVVDESPSLFKQMAPAQFKQHINSATTFTLNTGNSYEADPDQTFYTTDKDGNVNEITIGTSPYEEVGGANGSVTFSPAQVVAMKVDGEEVAAQGHDEFDAKQQEYAKALGQEYTTPELSTSAIRDLFNKVSDLESRVNEAEPVAYEPYQYLEPHMDFDAALAEKHAELQNEQSQEIAAGMTPVERAPYPVRIATPSGRVIPFAPSKSGLSVPQIVEATKQEALMTAKDKQANRIELVENKIDTSAATSLPPIESKLGANVGRSLDTIRSMKFGTKPAPVKPLVEGRDAKGKFARKAKPVTYTAPADLKMKKPVNSLFSTLGLNMKMWADANGKFEGVEVRDANNVMVMDTKMYHQLREDIAAGITPTLKRRVAMQSVLTMEELDSHVEALTKGEITPQEIVAKKFLDAGLISEYTADPMTKMMKVTFNGDASSLSFAFSHNVQMLANMASSFEFAQYRAGAVATASGGVAGMGGSEFNKRFLNPSAKRAEIEGKIKEAAIKFNWTTPRLKDGKEQLSEDGKVIMYTPEEAADYLNRINWAMAEGMALRQKVDPNKLYEVTISDVQLAESFIFGTPNELFQLQSDTVQQHVAIKGFVRRAVAAIGNMPQGTVITIAADGLPAGTSSLGKREEGEIRSALSEMYKLDTSLTNNIKGRLKYENGKDVSGTDYLGFIFDAAQLTDLTVEDARKAGQRIENTDWLYREQEVAWSAFQAEDRRLQAELRKVDTKYYANYDDIIKAAQALGIPNTLTELDASYTAAQSAYEGAMKELFAEGTVTSFGPTSKVYHISPSEDGGDMNVFLKGGGLEDLHLHSHNAREGSTNLGWIRFSVDKEGGRIIIDEIQSDVFAELHKEVKELEALEALQLKDRTHRDKIIKNNAPGLPGAVTEDYLQSRVKGLDEDMRVRQSKIDRRSGNQQTQDSLLRSAWTKMLLHKIVQEAAINGYEIGIVDPSVIHTRTGGQGTTQEYRDAITKSYGERYVNELRDVLGTYDVEMKKEVFEMKLTKTPHSFEQIRANTYHTIKLTPKAQKNAIDVYNAAASAEGTVLFSKAKGKPIGSFNTHTKVVKFFQGSNLHTGLHEMGHAWRYAMKGEDLAKARAWAHSTGTLPKGKKWTVSGEEKFANAFMTYALTNKNVQPQFKGLFSDLRQFLIALGQNVKPVIEFSPEMDSVMGNMLMAEINAQTPKVRKAIYDERRDLFQFDERADYSQFNPDNLDDLLKMLGVEYTATKVGNDELMAQAQLKYRNADYMADLSRRLMAGEDAQLNPVDVAIQQLMVKEVLEETIARFSKPMSAKARAKATKEFKEAFADDLISVKQSGTGAGRALQAFKMNGVKNRLILSQHMIDGLLTDAERHAVQAAFKKGEPSDKFKDEIMNPKAKKILWELYYMGLLSSPQTLGVNTVGTLVWSSLWQPVHITASGAIDAAVYRAAKSGIFTKTVRDWYYKGGPVQRQRYASEVFPVLTGYKKLPKALRIAWEIQTKGYSSSEIVSRMELDLHSINLETGARYKLNSETKKREIEQLKTEKDPVKRAALQAEIAKAGFNTAGGIFRGTMFHAGALMRFMRASDAVFTHLAYEGSIGRQAYRKGQQEGKTALEAKKITAKYTAEPTEEMQEEALAEARYNTYTDAPGAITKQLVGMREAPYAGVPARLLMPFISTPMNLLKRGLEMVPGVGLVAEAGHRAGKSPTTAGHTNADVIAKQLEGIIIAAVLTAYLTGGDDDGLPLFTGPAPDKAGERKRFYEQGKQPWSIRIKDTWYSYRFAEPFNTPLMILGALMGEIENGKAQESTVEEYLTRMTDAMEVIVNGSFMRNFEAITSDDDKKVQKMVANRLGGLVPYNGMFRFMAQMLNKANNEGNQVPRELDGFISQAVGNNIGGWALEMSIAYKKPEYVKFWQDLGVKEDVLLTTWGEPVVYNSQSMWLFWNPIKTKPAVVDDVEKELAKLSYYPSMPEREIDIYGKQVELDSDIYVQYLLSAGKQTKERMARLIKTPYYQRMEPEAKAELFQKEVRKARDTYRTRAGQEQAKRLRNPQRTL